MEEKLYDSQNRALKAGGIVVHTNKQGLKKILVLFRELTQDWTFPKGGIEGKELPEQTAIREVKEETNIDTKVMKPLPPIEYYDDIKDEVVYQHMFLLEPLDFVTEEENDGDKVAWLSIEKTENRLTHGNLKEYFREFKEHISI